MGRQPAVARRKEVSEPTPVAFSCALQGRHEHRHEVPSERHDLCARVQRDPPDQPLGDEAVDEVVESQPSCG